LLRVGRWEILVLESVLAGMTYAIVQQELIVPDVEQLKRAFSVSPDLTTLDAQTAANDA